MSAPGTTRDRKRPERGFNMIEMMIVMAIIGISLVVATPAFNKFKYTLAQNRGCQQIIDDLRGSRQVAVTRRVPVVVAFGNGKTTAATGYSMHWDTNGDAKVSTGERVVYRKLPKDVTCSKLELVPGDSVYFGISGLLKSGTGGGFVVVKTLNQLDTLQMSVAGMVYR